MAGKSTTDDKGASSHTGSHNWLSGCIDSLHQLMLTIASRVAHLRLRRHPMGDAKDRHDLWGLVENHITQMSENTESAEPPPADLAKPLQEAATPSPKSKPRKSKEKGDLGKYYEQANLIQGRLHIDKTLKSSTMGHINSALSLAAQGNFDGARLHIHLAEDGLQTVSRFLPHEEYEAFRIKVEARLAAFIESGNQSSASASDA